MFKLKFTTKKDIKLIYDGVEGFDIPEGMIVEVSSRSISNKGDILIRTNSNKTPFKQLRSGTEPYEKGSLWGNSLASYRFKILIGKKESDY